MASGINKAILIGNTGKDPVIRVTSNGIKVASFPLATSESWIDKATGKRREKTEWHNIVIYGEGLVNITEKFIKKGTKLYLEGTIQTRKWTDSENQTRVTTEIVLQGYNCTLSILDKKSNGSFTEADYHNSIPEPEGPVPEYKGEDDTDDNINDGDHDEIPF